MRLAYRTTNTYTVVSGVDFTIIIYLIRLYQRVVATVNSHFRPLVSTSHLNRWVGLLVQLFALERKMSSFIFHSFTVLLKKEETP